MSNYKQFSFAKQGTIPTKWISLAELASDGKKSSIFMFIHGIQNPRPVQKGH